MKKRNLLVILLALAVLSASVFLSGCQKSAEKQGAAKLAGTTINVLLPPWYKFSQDMLGDFTNKTGIKVNLQIMDWDPLTDKIVTSCAAGVAPADVTEFSWDWVGKFGAAGWYEPLNKYFDEKSMSDIITRSIFQYQGNYLAIPIYNDFRVTYINKKYFDQAGIAEIPDTPQKLLEDAKIIKQKGIVDYPVSVPFSATAGTTTPWFLLTKSYGGELFDKNWEPLFEAKDSPGYQAMAFLISGLKDDKVIDPASVGYQGTDIVDRFKVGKGAIDLAGWAGSVSTYTNPKESQIVDNVQVIKVPGINGNSRTYGLQEAVGIPSASKNKEAAAEFIKYLNTPEVVEKLYNDLGIFPNHQSTISELVKEKKLPDVMLEVMPTIQPLFPQGAPKWYTAFETDVATTMNQMAKGELTLDQGIKHIADNSRKLVKE